MPDDWWRVEILRAFLTLPGRLPLLKLTQARAHNILHRKTRPDRRVTWLLLCNCVCFVVSHTMAPANLQSSTLYVLWLWGREFLLLGEIMAKSRGVHIQVFKLRSAS
jgi:hypothetical protein